MNLGEPKKSGVTIPATRPIELPAPTPAPKRELVPVEPAKPAKVDAGA